MRGTGAGTKGLCLNLKILWHACEITPQVTAQRPVYHHFCAGVLSPPVFVHDVQSLKMLVLRLKLVCECFVEVSSFVSNN